MKTNEMILDEDKARGHAAEVARDAAAQKARSAYRDDSFPERACDRCGKNYRGPAVYCSLECATADA
jgi:hypothetical protein